MKVLSNICLFYEKIRLLSTERFSIYILSRSSTLTSLLIGTLRSDDRDGNGNENVKKQ